MKIKLIAAACAATFAVAQNSYAQDLSGIVKDNQGNVIANAKISVVNTKQYTITDANGEFTLGNMSQSNIELHVTKKAYSHNNRKMQVSAHNINDIEFVLSRSVMEIIDVHATPLHSSNIESATPINVITSDELRLKQASTLGETLKNEVGVHSTYFGPVASSPIIRGMDGPRVMVTQNGLDSGDASRIGPDHVVSSETATAQQIEVLRGPSTLFYGSGAIGGVVNVVDNRVPETLDKNFDYMLKHNDVANEDEASFALNTSSGQLAFHVDGFWRESDDYNIPGYAESASTHDDEHEEHDDHDDHEEEAGVKGKLLNSASKSSGFTVGTSYVLDNGFVGFSFGRMTREYGIPGHSHGSHEEEHSGELFADEHDDHDDHDDHDERDDENVYGDLEQDRIQFLSELTFSQGAINKVSSKMSYTDYQHKEIEDGEVGTIFNNEMIEARFDIFHQEYAGWKGAWTFHYKNTDFEAIGVEAFTPASETTSYAFAWLEEQHLSKSLLLQLGARIERVEVEAGEFHHDEEDDGHDEHGDEHFFDKQSFNPISVSAGLVWDYQVGYNLGFSFSYSQRAPSAAELFSNGPHIGTNSYEFGALYTIHQEGEEVHFDLSDQDVELETSTNIDITWRKFEGDFGFVLGAFYNHIDDYLYQVNTGLFADDGHGHEEEHELEGVHDDLDEHEEEGLPVYNYQQHDVEMYGVEAEVIYQWNSAIKISLFSDYIKAKLDGGDNLPRIPPMRVGGQFDYQGNNYAAQLSVTRYFEQDDIAEHETETDGYTMLDANFNYYLDGIGDDLVLFVKANNLTDEEARVHTSFLKNIAPLPARGFEIGMRGSF
ncbi:MAG: TonB-dependent receptor [Alteromonadaceae bacterium]|nr:TonB-dependent receptor [Alteromonadaceae bacterium]